MLLLRVVWAAKPCHCHAISRGAARTCQVEQLYISPPTPFRGWTRRVWFVLPPKMVPSQRPPNPFRGGGYFDPANSDPPLKRSRMRPLVQNHFLMDSDPDFERFLMPKSIKNQWKMKISIKLGFYVNFCLQNQGLKCFREVQNPWKHSDCCSKIDFAHLTTSAKASSWLGSIFLSKSINFPSQFETKNTSEANFIFCCNFGIQNHPKFDENPFQNAWSELRISTLGPLWPDQTWFLVSRTPSRAVKLLILLSYAPHLDPIFKLFNLFSHHF